MRQALVSALFVSFGLFAGRLSGFVREAFIASEFGASEETDLIIVFLSAPDILVNLLVAGALGMALIPEFKSMEKRQTVALYQQTMFFLFSVFLIVSVLAYLFSSEILNTFAPGLDNALHDKYSNIFGVTFVAIPLTVAAGVTTAFLHFKDKFLVPALGTFIFNMVLIIGLYFASSFDTERMLIIIALSVSVAALVRWLVQVLNSKTLPFSFTVLTETLLSTSIIKRYIYCVLTGGIIFLMPVIARSLASLNGAGELSLVNYAIKLVEFPLGVVLTVFAIVFFPQFSEYFSQRDEVKFRDTFQQVFLSVVAISIAVFVPLQLFSFSATSIVYDWGGLSLYQLQKIADYFYHVSSTLPFQGMNALLLAVIASRRDTISPLICTTLLAVLFTITGYGFIENIDGIFSLMIAVYALLSVALLSIIYVKHRVEFLSFNFVFDFLKLAIISLLYYQLLSVIKPTQGSVWLDILIAGGTSLLFLALCVLSCKNIRQIIRV
jgi:peptidoglycan biosynthesis protein MviN/MurJ (putative lipid II flippase)